MAERTLDWLERRSPAPPAALLERMAEAVRTAGAAVEGVPAIPAALGAAALDRLRAALAGPEDRAAALDLLAADALLTYACEAAAEIGPDALEATTRAFGPDRLAALIPGRP